MALSRLHKQILDELHVPDDLFIKIMVGVVVVELRDKRFVPSLSLERSYTWAYIFLLRSPRVLVAD